MSDYFENSASLRLKPFETSAAEILSELSAKDSDLIREFVDDPTGYLLSRLTPQAVAGFPRSTLSAANQFLYSALSNNGFKQWINNYNYELTSMINNDEFAQFDDAKIRIDVANALSEYADPSLMEALLKSSSVEIDTSSMPFTSALGENTRYPFAPTGRVVLVALLVVIVTVVVAAADIVGAKSQYSVKSEKLRSIRPSGSELADIAELLISQAEKLRNANKL